MTEQELQAPPHALEAEQSVIATVLCDATAIGKLADRLKPEDFYRKAHNLIYASALEMFRADNPIDMLTIQARLKSTGKLNDAGGLIGVAELALHYFSSATLDYHVSQIIDAAQRRAVIKMARYATEGAHDSESATLLLSKLQESVSKISGRGGSRRPTDLSVLSHQCFNTIEERSKIQGMPGVTTGYERLDDLTGGFVPGEMTIVAGRTSMGKTAFALNLVHNAIMHGKTVALFSIEMSQNAVVQRLLSRASEVDSKKLRFGRLTSEDWGKLAGVLQYPPGLCHIFDVTDGIDTTAAIEATLRRMDKLPDLIVIDHLHELRMEDPNSRLNKNDQWDLVCKDIKKMLKVLKLPGVLLAQLSRALEARNDKRPVLADLRESGTIEQHADIVLMIYRDVYHNPDSTASRECEVLIRKNRDGELGKVYYHFIPEVGTFHELAANYQSQVKEEKPRYGKKGGRFAPQHKED